MNLKITLIASSIFFSLSIFAEEFNNLCVTSLSEGNFHQTDCSINHKLNEKVYCFGNQSGKDIFLNNPDKVIKQAENFYKESFEDERVKVTQDQAHQAINDPECDLSNLDVSYLNFADQDLTHCRMVNTSFFGADLRGVNLSGANLQRAYLNLARIEKTNFNGSNLSMAIIFQPIFEDNQFNNANLSGARVIGTLGKVNMSNANLSNGRLGLDVGNQPMGQMKFDSSGGNFEGTNFEGADLHIASFKFGNLKNANLKNTKLTRSELIRADLTGADLTGADLTNADINGANFKDAKGMDRVIGWKLTTGKCLNCPAR